MTNIQPISIPTKGEGNLFQIQALNFPMNPTSVTFYWQVLDEELATLLDGNLTMDADTYNQWSNNDEFVIQWACDLLGFTIIS